MISRARVGMICAPRRSSTLPREPGISHLQMWMAFAASTPTTKSTTSTPHATRTTSRLLSAAPRYFTPPTPTTTFGRQLTAMRRVGTLTQASPPTSTSTTAIRARCFTTQQSTFSTACEKFTPSPYQQQQSQQQSDESYDANKQEFLLNRGKLLQTLAQEIPQILTARLHLDESLFEPSLRVILDLRRRDIHYEFVGMERFKHVINRLRWVAGLLLSRSDVSIRFMPSVGCGFKNDEIQARIRAVLYLRRIVLASPAPNPLVFDCLVSYRLNERGQVHTHTITDIHLLSEGEARAIRDPVIHWPVHHPDATYCFNNHNQQQQQQEQEELRYRREEEQKQCQYQDYQDCQQQQVCSSSVNSNVSSNNISSDHDQVNVCLMETTAAATTTTTTTSPITATNTTAATATPVTTNKQTETSKETDFANSLVCEHFGNTKATTTTTTTTTTTNSKIATNIMENSVAKANSRIQEFCLPSNKNDKYHDMIDHFPLV